MFRKYILPAIALCGIGFALFMIYWGSKQPPVAPVIFPPAVSPYKHYIAGEGVIESVYKNIDLGNSYADVVTDVYVKVGDVVKKGTPLFKLDTRQFEAQLAQALQELKFSEIDYKDQLTQFSFYERLRDKTAVSEQAYKTAFYNKELARQRVETAKASVRVIKTSILRSTTYSPIDGEVLQVNVRVGEFANVNPFTQQTLMVFGDTQVLHLRIDIDEEDSWRVIMGAPARAYVRGNNRISIPLEFVYYEPLIIPKTSLSGSDVERVDTRVLQLVYRFEKNKYPVFIGQLLDVFVEAHPSEEAR